MIEQLAKKGGVRIVGYGMGGKGGGAARKPVETTDNLHSISYAKIVLLLSEGEVYGPSHLSTNLLRDIYLDGTPIANDDGSLNFEGVEVEFRAGTQTQDYIPGFPDSEATVGVGVELRAATPYVRSITNTDLTALRVTVGVDGLSKADTNNGDVLGLRVDYKIELSTDGGAFQTVISTAFDGKTTQRYTRTHRIELPEATSGWQVRITRTTANANSSLIADRTFIDSFTDVIDYKFRRPMSALIAIKVDAKQFQSIPRVGVRCKGRLIKVPSNYDPETRTYTGTWNGTFKVAYSNNPAWLFYDMLTNQLYGLGEDIPVSWNNKWACYEIGQYCDQMVPDGKGGLEPRFTGNVYFQQGADAWKVVQDLASIFFGIAYYGGGAVVPVADMPKDPVYTYTKANVKDGSFKYNGSARNTRYTVALVSWNDLTDMGRAKVEVVQDDDAVRRYGFRKSESVAFGCTSQGQAQRRAREIIFTAQKSTRSVNFTVGLDGSIANPGQVIRVANSDYAGREIGGRIISATLDSITIDRPVSATPGDLLTVILPTGVAETRTVITTAGDVLTADTVDLTADSTEVTADSTGLPSTLTSLTVDQDFSVLPEIESVWTLESYDLYAQTFRVVQVVEREGIEFDIAAVQHVPQKYGLVDTGTIIELPPESVIPAAVQAAPVSVTITSYSIITQGVAEHVMVISWPKVEGAIAYDVQWKRDNSNWIPIPRTGLMSIEVPNIYTGSYLARVRALNAFEIPSIWTMSTLTDLEGNLSPPPVVTHLLTVSIPFGIHIEWGFPDSPSIIEKTEIWYSLTSNFVDAIKLGDFSYPQNTHTLMGLAAGQRFFFWARLVDKNGVEGNIYPTGLGKEGTASASAEEILGYLTDKITDTQLSQELLTRIDASGDSSVVIEEIVNMLAAMYTIKTQVTVDGHTYIAGIGVGVENDEGIVESQVLVAADRFAIIHPNGSGTVVPFVVQGGQVFISSAFIANGTITNAMIGGAIQSTNFISNVQGWQLDKAGTFQMNGTGGTGRLVMRNNVIKVYDTNGVLRVQMGDLTA